MFKEHVEALGSVLIGERHASAFQRFASAVTRPGPRQFLAPGAKRGGVNDGRSLSQPMGLADIHNVRIAIPDQFDSSEWVVPAKVNATNARPVRRKLSMIDGEF